MWETKPLTLIKQKPLLASLYALYSIHFQSAYIFVGGLFYPQHHVNLCYLNLWCSIKHEIKFHYFYLLRILTDIYISRQWLSCRLGSRWIVFQFPGRTDFFLPSLCPERNVARLVSCVIFIGHFLLGSERTDPEADYIRSSITELKNEWSYSFTSLHVLKRDNFAFTLSATR
jgi:hypothetical protein